MPVLSNTTRWRSHPQSTSGFLYLLNPDVVIKRRINQDVFVFPITELTYDNPDGNPGSYTDTEVFQTVVIKDGTTEAIKGMTYVNFPLDSDTIPVGVLSFGDIELLNNDIIEVWDDFRLWARLPRIDSTGILYKDWTRVFPGAANVLPPKANGGVWYAAKIDPDTEEITVDFDWTNSFATTSGAIITGYLVDVRDGTITVGTSTSSTLTATFPAGKRWVKLTVTDSNARAADTYILVVAADDDTALSVTSVTLQGSREGGWEAGFNVLENDVSDYPDGTACIYWVEEDYAGTIGSLNGQADREHIAFTGWLTRDTSLIAPDNSDWQITASNAIGIMRQLPAFSQTLERPTGTAESWFEVPSLDWWRYVTFLLEWHSTLFFVCDVVRPSFYADFPVKQLDAETGSLLNQMEYAAKAVKALFSCDHQGRCYFELNQHLMDSSEQSAATTTVSITAADWVGDISVQSQYQNRVAMVVGYAVVPSSSSISAVQSRAPGVAPGQGGGTETLDRQLADQNDLNTRVGRLYHYRNRATENIGLTINHQGIVADPAWGEFIQVTIASSTNKRGTSAAAAKMVLTRVNVSYDWNAGTEEQSWELEPVASFDGGDGITVVQPGDPAPESGEYVPQEGTWGDQVIQPPQFYAPFEPYIPTVIDSSTATGYAVAWGNDNLSITADLGVTWTESDNVGSGFYCLSVIHSGNPDPATDPVKMTALWTDDTDCIIRYNDDVFGAGTWTTEQTFTGYVGGILRHVAGVAGGGGFAAFLVSPTIAYNESFDFASDEEGFAIVTDTPGFGFSEGVYSGGEGWKATQNANTHWYCFAELEVQPMTVTDVAWTGYSQKDLSLGMGSDGFQIGLYSPSATVEDQAALNNTGQNAISGSESGTWAGVTRIRVRIGVTNTAPNTLFYVDSLDVQGEREGTVVVFTDDYWATVSESGGGAFVSGENLAGDSDDHNLGVFVFAANHGIWYTSAYDQTTALELSGLTGLDGSAAITLVRVPYALVNNAAMLNDTKTALQFVFGTDSPVSGKTLWLVTFNANTGAISSQVNITPIIAGTTYFGLRAESYETSGTDTTKALLLGVPVGGDADDTVLLYTGSSGAGWQIQNSTQTEDLIFIRWVVGSTQQAWAAAGGSVNKPFDTSNRGTLLNNRLGDLAITDLRGVYGFNVI